MNTKVDQTQKSIEMDARKLIEALKSGKGIISVWEITCQDMLNPVRKAWIELCSKILHDPEKCKTCNDFVRLVHQFEELPPTQQEVETGIMNGFGGPYGDDNRLDLIAITEKLFPHNTLNSSAAGAAGHRRTGRNHRYGGHHGNADHRFAG